MKMLQEDYKLLLREVSSLSSQIPQHREEVKKSGKFTDLEKRIRWDVFAVVNRHSKFSLSSKLYRYLNDSHIDTALKSIMKELNLIE